MSDARKPLDPYLVMTAVLVSIPLLWVIGMVLFSQGDECSAEDASEVGSVLQLFVPGVGCETPRPGTGTPQP